MIRITALNTFPVKSCAGIALTEARITPRGLEHDRDYMLVRDDGSFLSQRQVPEMALIRPTIGEDAITLTAPGMASLDVPLGVAPDAAEEVEATVHGKPVTGQRLGDEYDAWFTRFLPAYRENRGYRLLRVREDLPRWISGGYRRAAASNQVGFADGHSILLASEPSLAELNTELAQPVQMNRFRPNVVVGGPGLPAYDEDYWGDLQIGGLAAFVVKACDRCAIPDVDPETAHTGKAVRRALTTRRGANAYDASNQGVFFAQNLAHTYAPGVTIRVGDPVRVLSRSAAPNVVLRTTRAAAA